MKALLYQLFGTGSIPEDLVAILQQEYIVVVDEGLRGSWLTKNFKSPGRRSLYRAKGIVGSLVITRKRIVAYAFNKPQINLPVDDPRMVSLYTELISPDKISLSFESADFHSDWQGVIELRYRTEKARAFHDALLHLGAKQGRAE